MTDLPVADAMRQMRVPGKQFIQAEANFVDRQPACLLQQALSPGWIQDKAQNTIGAVNAQTPMQSLSAESDREHR